MCDCAHRSRTKRVSDERALGRKGSRTKRVSDKTSLGRKGSPTNRVSDEKGLGRKGSGRKGSRTKKVRTKRVSEGPAGPACPAYPARPACRACLACSAPCLLHLPLVRPAHACPPGFGRLRVRFSSVRINFSKLITKREAGSAERVAIEDFPSGCILHSDRVAVSVAHPPPSSHPPPLLIARSPF